MTRSACDSSAVASSLLALGEIRLRHGDAAGALGDLDEAASLFEKMERAFQVLAADEPDEDLATLAAQLGRLYFFKGDLDLATERAETALAAAEALRLPEVISQTFSSLAAIAIFRGQYEHSLALVKHALDIALEHNLWEAALRAYINLGETLCRRDRLEDAVERYETGLALARRIGNRNWEWAFLVEMAYPLGLLGRWDESLAAAQSVSMEQIQELSLPGLLSSLPPVLLARRRIGDVEELLASLHWFGTSADVQVRTSYAGAQAELLRAQGRVAEAVAPAAEAREAVRFIGAASQPSKLGYVEGLEAALALGRLDEAEALVGELEALSPGSKPPFLQAQANRFRGRLAAARGDHDEAEQAFEAAAALFREFGMPVWLAVVQLEQAEWLVGQGRQAEAEPLLAEARDAFERVEAVVWLERLDAARPAAARIAAEAS